ncbi:MAG: hypothetical protein HYR85_02840 [Planctomycetes bacterium]|nr:hypothetical protein [Planctomycetota bacterium]MBI3843125.1 hypothetical protein [Planctomycetota bacterium]
MKLTRAGVRWVALVCAILAGCASPTRREGSLLDRAIAAAGGESRLANVRGLTWKSKGTLANNDKAIPYDATWAFSLPLSFRWTLESDGARSTEGFDGASAWADDGSGASALDGDRARAVSEMAMDNRVSLLVPLRSNEFVIEERGEGDVRGRPALLLRVDCSSRDYHRTLYFDRETLLLAKTEGPTVMPVNGSSQMEIFLSDYRAIDGVKYPHHSEVWFAGKVMAEDSLVEIHLEPADAAHFRMPVRP